jgi:hypothetical protein
VKFFDRRWKAIGTRKTLAQHINAITRVDVSILNRDLSSQYEMEDRLQSLSIHSRMVWASKRMTTRPEDRAYSLMGIFQVNMPLLYGEGGNKAFQRLQEEIIKGHDDQSILIHTGRDPLANSPDDFSWTETFQRNPKRNHYLLERIRFGIRTSLLLYPLKGGDATLGIVDSLFADDPSKLCRPALWLQKTENENEYFVNFVDVLMVRRTTSGDMEAIERSCW